MQIDLNHPFTTEDVANLLRSKDDNKNRQLRVTDKGIAYLSDETGKQNIANLAFRFETSTRGNGYTGEEAANNEEFVARIEKALRKNWPDPSDTYIDVF